MSDIKDSSTYKYPRSMQEAFGPYTDHKLHVDPEATDLTPWMVWAVLVILFGVGLWLFL